MKAITLKELMAAMKREKIKLPLTTFKFYQKIGLIPGPVAKVRGKRGGVYGQYPSMVVRMVKLIHRYQNKGWSLDKIIDLFEKRTLERFKAELQKWGFSKYTLPELSGFTPDEIASGEKYSRSVYEDGIEKFYPELSGTEKDKVLIRVLCDSFDPDKIIEHNILKELRWYFSDYQIEAYTLNHIAKTIDARLDGLNMAVTMLIKNGHLDQACLIESKFYEISVLLYKANMRLAELAEKYPTLTGGKGIYSGQTKEQWSTKKEHAEKMFQAYQKKLSEVQEPVLT